jgi:ArsR family transcriptional regulator
LGTTKSHVFTERQNQLAKVAKALGHPARIAILDLLKQRDCICGDIVEELDLSQSTISQHLKELKEAGLIRGQIDGPKTCYCINTVSFGLVSNDLQQLLTATKGSCGPDCC